MTVTALPSPTVAAGPQGSSLTLLKSHFMAGASAPLVQALSEVSGEGLSQKTRNLLRCIYLSQKRGKCNLSHLSFCCCYSNMRDLRRTGQPIKQGLGQWPEICAPSLQPYREMLVYTQTNLVNKMVTVCVCFCEKHNKNFCDKFEPGTCADFQCFFRA